MTHLEDPAYRDLLRGVLADPNDLAPRHVLADWLLEHPDPAANHRGRVVMGQLAGRSLYRKDARVLLGGLERRFRNWRAVWSLSEMESGHNPHVPRLASHYEDGPVSFHLRWGFVFRVDLDVREWDAHGRAVFEAQPVTETRTGHQPRPVRFQKSGREAQLWHASPLHPRGWLPAGLFEAVRRQPEIDYRPAGRPYCGVMVPAADRASEAVWCRDEAEDLAREALDRALIEWGRERAGLAGAAR